MANDFQPSATALVEWLRFEAFLRQTAYDTYSSSDDEEENRMSSGYLASARWLTKAADMLEQLSTPEAGEQKEAPDA